MIIVINMITAMIINTSNIDDTPPITNMLSLILNNVQPVDKIMPPDQRTALR